MYRKIDWCYRKMFVVKKPCALVSQKPHWSFSKIKIDENWKTL
jgi:hypothetical protein